ncbi:MAG: ribonuclease III domain-containing protein [Cyanobacteria bacterium CAN_BIN43]|nr:ribonuclease III domain-containing protein [Cyanobacteria bacterium CAN_BIN43]
MIHKLDIKLEEAKQAIAITDFTHDDLLKLALTDLSTLQLPAVLKSEQQVSVLQYRRLAFLGDRLLDAVLADYLFAAHPELSNQDLDGWRQDITCRESLIKFAIDLGLPNFCSSWNRPKRKPPESEPGVYGEMFEALVAVIYLDGDRNFERVYGWLRDRFIKKAVESYEEQP